MNFCGGRLAPPSFSVSSAMRPSKQPTPKHETDFARPLVGGSSPRALMRLQEFCKNLASDLARAPTKSDTMNQAPNCFNAVGLHHVADDDFGGVALGVDDPKLAVLFLDCQRAALHCFQLRLAASGLNAFTQVFGGEATWHDMIGQ